MLASTVRQRDYSQNGLFKGKLLASDSLCHKALHALNSPENSFVISFVSEPLRGIVVHGWHYHMR